MRKIAMSGTAAFFISKLKTYLQCSLVKVTMSRQTKKSMWLHTIRLVRLLLNHAKNELKLISQMIIHPYFRRKYGKERMKTVSVALILCLHLGVDPPGKNRPNPCAKLQVSGFPIPCIVISEVLSTKHWWILAKSIQNSSQNLLYSRICWPGVH